MTSSTTASYGSRSAFSRPSAPSPATSTTNPSAVSPLRRAAVSRVSSSTSRRRMPTSVVARAPALSVLTARGLQTRSMRTLTARPALRWLIPLAVLLAVLASFLVTTRANAKDPLPGIAPQDLLAKVVDAKVDGLSGTVVENADLGIPVVPGGSDSPGGKLTSLLAGSHTMRVWYGAPGQARLAVNDQYAET